MQPKSAQIGYGYGYHWQEQTGTNVLCAYSDPGADDLCPAYAKNQEESFIQYVFNGKPHIADVDENTLWNRERFTGC
jgi:hypothetical protein